MKEYAQRKDDEKSPAQIRRAKVMRMNADKKRVARKKEEDLSADKAEKKAIQAKLEISEPGDKHEQQADSVAKKVVGGEDASNEMQMQYSSSEVNTKKEEGTLMAKSEDGTLNGTDKLQTTLDSSKGSGQALDDKTKSEMGEKMGKDLSDVKIHTDNKANEMNEGINAKAFTHDQDIYFKQGNFDTTTPEGKELLAHELTHTQQNKNEDVQRKIQRKLESPEENTDFEAISPSKKGVVNKVGLLYESTHTDLGTEIQLNQLLRLLYQSTDKKWFFAETIDPKPVSGYLLQSDVTESTEITSSTDNVGADNFKVEGNESLKEKTEKINSEKEGLTNVEEKKTLVNENTSGIPYANPENKIVFGEEKPKEEIKEDLLTLGKKEEKAIVPQVDIPAKRAKFEALAKNKKSAATNSINFQIGQIKKYANNERIRTNDEAKAKTQTIGNSYDNTISEVETFYKASYENTYKLYLEEKARISTEKKNQLDALDNGTSERVKRLQTEGEAMALEVEQNKADQIELINSNYSAADLTLALLIIDQIAHYNVPERKTRMEDDLGLIKEEAMLELEDIRVDLIEQVEEDSADVAEEIRDKYAEVAEELPEQKESVSEKIEELAQIALQSIDDQGIAPLLLDITTNTKELISKLKKEKAETLAQIESLRKDSIDLIDKEEEEKTKQLKEDLKNFNAGIDGIVKDVNAQAEILPDVLMSDYIDRATEQVETSHSKLSNQASVFTGNVKKVLSEISQSTIDTYVKIEQDVLTLNTSTLNDYKTKVGDTCKGISDVNKQIADDVTVSMTTAVNDYLKGLDKIVDDCLLELETEKNTGIKEINLKVTDTFTETAEIVKNAAEDIKDEAEQLATEWEATYWTRQALDVLGFIFKWLAIIVGAIILIIFLIILFIVFDIAALIALVVDLIVTYVVALFEVLLPGLLQGLRYLITEFLSPLMARVGTWFVQVFGKEFLKQILFLVSTWLFFEGVKKMWEGIIRTDLPMRERDALMLEGILYAATSVVSEWQILKATFGLTKGFQLFESLVALIKDAKLAARLVNLAKGDLGLSLEIAKLMKTSELRAILPLVDDVLELQKVLGLLGNDALRLQKMLLYAKNVTEVSRIIELVGDAALAERLLVTVADGNQLLGLLTKVPNAAKLEELLAVTPRLAELSDEALLGMQAMTKDELAALNGKTIVEIEEAGVKKGLNLEVEGPVVNKLDDVIKVEHIPNGAMKGKRVGHTFSKHGSHNTHELQMQAKNSGTPQGQWLDDVAAEDFIAQNLDKTKNGTITIELPQGMGRVVNPDGTFSAATHVTLVPSGSGVKTAFPLIP